MAAWSNPGSGRAETTSSAQRSPCASEIATRTGAGRTAADRIRASCSSTVRTASSTVQSGGQPGTQVGADLPVVEREVDDGADGAGRAAEDLAATAADDPLYRV